MFTELSNAQRRQYVDVIQIFEAWEESRQEMTRRFAGSMRWVERKGHVYLLRKRGNSEVSLGRKTDETEKMYQAFRDGRDEERNRSAHLNARLKEMAPVNRALRLNRVPRTPARILRHLSNARILGKNVYVVGTNSLYLYEALAGIHFSSDLLATTDGDVPGNPRKGVGLAIMDVQRTGIIGCLRRADSSFRLSTHQPSRAVNRDGFMVDLIRPIGELSLGRRGSDNPRDLVGAGIEGLEWLVNAPKVDGVVVGEDGLPVRFWSVDPRAFALHKAWVAQRADREPVRRTRDMAHAREVAAITRRYLGMELSDPALSALPVFLRRLADRLDDAR